MSDLTIEHYYCCDSAKRWSIQIGNYNIAYGPTINGQYEYDYSCECKGFQFRKKCKHIEEAKRWHCNWQQMYEGGKVKDNHCPKCGNEVFVQAYGV